MSTNTVSSAESSWLVGIDLQNIFADPSSPWATPDYQRALAATQTLAPAFVGRTALTRFVAPAIPQGAWVPYYQEWAFALQPDDAPLYRLSAELDPVDAVVITRETFGKWDAQMHADLGHCSEIILTGVSTDCCVLSTALVAADAGVRVRVVADACAGLSEADHQRALDAMALYGPLITITSVAEILAEFGPKLPAS